MRHKRCNSQELRRFFFVFVPISLILVFLFLAPGSDPSLFGTSNSVGSVFAVLPVLARVWHHLAPLFCQQCGEGREQFRRLLKLLQQSMHIQNRLGYLRWSANRPQIRIGIEGRFKLLRTHQNALQFRRSFPYLHNNPAFGRIRKQGCLSYLCLDRGKSKHLRFESDKETTVSVKNCSRAPYLPNARCRKVTICARLQSADGLKAVAEVPVVMPFCTAQSTAV